MTTTSPCLDVDDEKATFSARSTTDRICFIDENFNPAAGLGFDFRLPLGKNVGAAFHRKSGPAYSYCMDWRFWEGQEVG